MINASRLLLYLALAVVLSGCAGSPLLYQNTVSPYTTDYDNTRVGSKKCVVKSYKIRVPVAGSSVTAEWDVDSVIKAARMAGITNICYADEHVLSILTVYRRKSLIVYGD